MALSAEQKRQVRANLSVAFNGACWGAERLFHWCYIPLIIWLGSKTTEDGLLNAIFPPV
jgi:hypothetical protein